MTLSQEKSIREEAALYTSYKKPNRKLSCFSCKYIAYLERPAVLFGRLSQLPNGRGKVRGEGSVDVRLQFRKVDLDELIVLTSAVWR